MKSLSQNKLTLSTVHVEAAARLKSGAQGLLTRKEALIASYLLSGYTVKDIARFLYRSKSTVKMHIQNMKRKCQCESRTRLGAVLQDFLKNSPGDNI